MALATTQSELVTSYLIYVTAQNSQQHLVGQILSIDPSEGRDITDSFVLGNEPVDEPFELIPGVVNRRQLEVRYVSLYLQPLQLALQTDAKNSSPGNAVSLTQQSTPFDIQENVTNPATGQTKTRTYQGCFIENYGATRNIENRDIRVIERATIRYRSLSGTNFQ